MFIYIIKLIKPIALLTLLIMLSVAIYHYYPHRTIPAIQAQELVVEQLKRQVVLDQGRADTAVAKVAALPSLQQVLVNAHLDPGTTEQLVSRDEDQSAALQSLQVLSEDQGKMIAAQTTLNNSEKTVIANYKDKIYLYEVIAGVLILILVIVLI